METDVIEADVLIIGAGMAGCRAAVEAVDHGARVVMTTKGLFGRDGSAKRQGMVERIGKGDWADSTS